MSRKRNSKPRCSDPYREGSGRWRVITRSGEGEEGRPSFATEAEAWAFVLAARADIEARNRTVEQALADYLAYKTAQGLKPRTLETLTFRLNGFFSPHASLPLCDLRESHGIEFYALYHSHSAAATHHGALSVAKGFAVWCLKEKLLTSDPLVEIETIGRAKKGKPQLHLDEARRLVDCAVKTYCEDKDEAGLAVLMALILGLRTGEVVGRKVRDVDDDGRVLCVGNLDQDDTRTERSVGRIQVPEDLQVLLKRQIKGRQPFDPLFTHKGGDFVTDSTRRLCKLAGVLEVTGQSLRGLRCSLALEQGITPQFVAQSLRHSEQMTRTHYAAPGAVQSSSAKRVFGVIQGGTDNRAQSVPNA